VRRNSRSTSASRRKCRAAASANRATSSLGFERRGTKTILADLDRRVPYLAQRALYFDEALPGMQCIFMITTSKRSRFDSTTTREVRVRAETRVAERYKYPADKRYLTRWIPFKIMPAAYANVITVA
jgi:hypothetical protein